MPDVIVIGGGLMGSSAAFFLSLRKRKVLLLERDLVGSKASGASFGNVRRQGRAFHQLALANYSRELWGRLHKLVDADVEFMATGHLRVAHDEAQLAKSEAYAREARDHGLNLEILGRNALRERFPFVGPRAIGGCFSPLDGNANPRLATPALARAAVRLGAEVRENDGVVSVEKAGEDFVVRTASGRSYRAPVVLASVGAWGGRLSDSFGEPVPIAAGGPQMAVTEPVPYFLKSVIGVASGDINEIIYFRQVKRGNIVMGGGPRVLASLDPGRVRPDPTLFVRRMPEFAKLVPGLAHLTIIRSWSGVEGYTQDHLPVVGASGTTPGLFYAFGFSGEGFQLGPAIGSVMAELIDTGRTTIDISPYSIRRFASGTV